jgi:hypothetical protein
VVNSHECRVLSGLFNRPFRSLFAGDSRWLTALGCR